MAKKPWVLTEKRKAALKKAQRVHVEMVEAGRSALEDKRKRG